MYPYHMYHHEFVLVWYMNLIEPARCASITIIAIFALIRCAETPDRLDTVYTDPQFCFRIEAPDTGWSLTDATGIPNVLLVIKSDNPVDGFYPNVTVSIENLTINMTEEEYGEQNKLLLLSQGFAIISTRSIVTQNILCFEIACERTEAETIMRFGQLCLVRNRIGYIITRIMPERVPNRIQREMDMIARSFRFI